jgi:type VII secretion-associated serine protease mycosin
MIRQRHAKEMAGGLLACGLLAVVLIGLIGATHAQSTTPNDPHYGEQWALEIVGAPCAWGYTTGSDSVTVAVLDSGVDLTHPDLVGRLRDDGYDFADDDDDPSDENGHGTHVAGIIAATLDNAEGVVGLAPSIQVLPVRVLDEEGSSDDPVRSIADGIRYATEQGANVINMSLGMTYMGDENDISPEIASALETAQQQGVLVVIASGNSFVPLPNVVASNNPDVMVVAASDDTDTVTPYSNTGPWVDVLAPGEHIYSTMPTYEVLLTSDQLSPMERLSQNYDYMSGTSMAAPYVSALAALLFSAHPDWSADQVQEAIKSNAFAGVYANHPEIYERLQFLGTGRIDACAALEDAPPVAGQQPAPTAAPAPTPPPTAPAVEEADDDAAAVQVAQEFVAALQANDIDAANALIDPSRTDLVVGPSIYLDFAPHLDLLRDATYVVADSDGDLVWVEATYTDVTAPVTLVFTISQVGNDRYIYDYDVPPRAR